MVGVPECGTLRRANEMVGAETVYLFIGGHYWFFGSAFVAGIGGGSLFLSVVVLYDTGDYCPDVNLGDPVSGWPSLVCIIFMVSGIQLFCTGIVGEYLSKTYLETKHRPIFILKDSSDEKEGNGHEAASV